MVNKYAIYKAGEAYYFLVSAWHSIEEAWQNAVVSNGEIVVKQIGEDWPPSKVLYQEIESRIQNRDAMLETIGDAHRPKTIKHDERIDHIVDKLIMLRKQTDTLSMAKAELLTEVKDDKLYKERYGNFGTFCQVIGYHRTTVSNLIAAYKLPAVRDAYTDIGAMSAKAIVTAHNAGLSHDAIQDLIEYAKDHKSAAVLRKAQAVIEEHNSQDTETDDTESEKVETVSAKTKRYWINVMRGWAKDRLSPPQFDECKAVLDELEKAVL